jgi:putative phosphoribosyl transferase
VVLGIARGGIPVGYSLAKSLGGILDVVTARKLPIPWNPEAGFGAVAPDGTIFLNRDMVRRLGLGEVEIGEVAREVLAEVRRREEVYRGKKPFPALEGREVILTDDGLATGYTMLAAIAMVRKRGPGFMAVAVPVSPEETARMIEPLVDLFLCLHRSRRYPFAVASFYRDFRDLTDEEVRGYLERFHDRPGQPG